LDKLDKKSKLPPMPEKLQLAIFLQNISKILTMYCLATVVILLIKPVHPGFITFSWFAIGASVITCIAANIISKPYRINKRG